MKEGDYINCIQIYLYIESKIQIYKKEIVRIKDIGAIYCNDNNVKNIISNIEILKAPNKEQKIIISAIDIISKINNKFSNLNISIMGSHEVLIDVKSKEKNKQLNLYLKVVLVSLVLFFGAGLAILNFHEDVNMKDSLKTIHYIITGKKVERPLLLEISYSLGLGVGMITFFNVLRGKNRISEPSPLEIEMHSYQKNIDDYILDNTKHNKE